MPLPQRMFIGPVSDFELKLLRVFSSVVECGGFSAAEAELGISMSAISKQVKDLEIRMSCVLCHRGRAGFSLTKEGEAVYSASASLFRSVEDFRSKINTFQNELSGILMLGMVDSTTTITNWSFQDALTRFSSEFPLVDLHVVTGSDVEIEQSLKAGRLHIAITTAKGELGDLRTKPVYQEKNYLYCGRQHALFGVDVTHADLEGLVCARHGYSMADAAGITNLRLESRGLANSTEGMLFLLRTGNFVGYLPEHFAREWALNGELHPLNPELTERVVEIQAIAGEEASSTPLIEKFLELLGQDL